MKSVDLNYAQTHLRDLVEDAKAGEDVQIAVDSGGVIRLRFELQPARRIFGLDQGKLVIPDDFDAPSPEIEHLFLGSDLP